MSARGCNQVAAPATVPGRRARSPRAGGTVEDGAEVVAISLFRLAGVDGDPDPQLDTVRPCSRCQGPLACQPRRGGIAGQGEDAEDAVALTSVLDERAPCAATTSATIRSWRARAASHLPECGSPRVGSSPPRRA